jgi:hypothetical protein
LPSIESLRHALFGSSQVLSGGPNSNNKPGSATGEIIGGNLSILVDSLLTSADADFTDKILIVEEIDEYFYKHPTECSLYLFAGRCNNVIANFARVRLVVGLRHLTAKDIQQPGGVRGGSGRFEQIK